MPLVINQLTPVDSTRLVLDALHSYWPACHFTVAFSDTAATLQWTDGPVVSDVLAVADRFTPDPDASDWENCVIIAHPDGNLEAVLPTFPELLFRREYSAKTVMDITQGLRRRGVMPDGGGNGVRRILQTRAHQHPDALAIHTRLAELSSPLPADTWQRESGVYAPMPEDLAVIALCDALREWSDDPDTFDQWETIYEAFNSRELQAVMASALIDNKPNPGDMEMLLDTVILDCLEAGDIETVAGADYVRDLMRPEDDEDVAGLFARPLPEAATVLLAMGRLLREVTGARL